MPKSHFCVFGERTNVPHFLPLILLLVVVFFPLRSALVGEEGSVEAQLTGNTLLLPLDLLLERLELGGYNRIR